MAARGMTRVVARAEAAMAAGAEALAVLLRGEGLAVSVEAGRLVVSGKGLSAREFGTGRREPQPVVGPVVAAFGPVLAGLVAAAAEEGRDG